MIYKGKRILEEAPETGDKYRRAYAEGINAYISRLNSEGRNNRQSFMPTETFKDKIEDYRAMYIKMLGIDRVDTADCPPPAKAFVASDDMCDIYRLTVYITKEIPFYAMLFVPHGIRGKAPLVVMQHGGGGSPERIKAYYNAMNCPDKHCITFIVSFCKSLKVFFNSFIQPTPFGHKKAC